MKPTAKTRCGGCNESKVICEGDGGLPIVSYCGRLGRNVGSNSFCQLEGVADGK